MGQCLLSRRRLEPNDINIHSILSDIFRITEIDVKKIAGCASYNFQFIIKCYNIAFLILRYVTEKSIVVSCH